MKAFDRIRKRLGDFWWYTLLHFAATRSGDLINAFIGLWLVPKFVSSEELGAVLPLTQFAAVLALPVSVFGMAFMKYVNVLAAEGRKGEMKSLLRGVFMAAAALAVLAVVVARFTMAPVLERLRIEKGMLGVLIIAAGFLGAVAPVYTNALQALKRFRELSLLAALGAPIRLVVMLVTMPIRALSGYFTGQSSVCLWQIACSVFALRRELGADVKSVPFWTRTNTLSFVRYSFFVTLYHLPALALFAEALIIRQRLPSVDSAGYYMISKFAEIGTYAGASLMAILFPYASETAQKGGDTNRMLLRTMWAAMIFGGLCAAGFAVTGRWLLPWLPGGEAYAPYVPQLVVLTVVLTMFTALNCVITGEVAAGRFGFLKWSVPVHLIYIGVLFGISGHGYFRAWLPEGAFAALARLNACGLNWLLGAMLMLQAVKLIFVLCDITRRKSLRQKVVD